MTTDPFALLDELIDEYLRSEKRHRPRLGYPRKGAGFGDADSNRTWESADELLEGSVTSIRMNAMSGAWESLKIRQERAIRIDADNRRVGADVLRVANLTAIETAAEVRAAKALLRSLLIQRNILV